MHGALGSGNDPWRLAMVMRGLPFLTGLPDITGSFELFSASKIPDRRSRSARRVAKRVPEQPECNPPPDLERFEKGWANFLKDIRIRLGTLLKVDNVSMLLGAGASRPAGGPLLGSVPLALEKNFLDEGITNDQVREWLDVFYSAVSVVAREPSLVPVGQDKILERSANLSIGSTATG